MEYETGKKELLRSRKEIELELIELIEGNLEKNYSIWGILESSLGQGKSTIISELERDCKKRKIITIKVNVKQINDPLEMIKRIERAILTKTSSSLGSLISLKYLREKTEESNGLVIVVEDINYFNKNMERWFKHIFKEIKDHESKVMFLLTTGNQTLPDLNIFKRYFLDGLSENECRTFVDDKLEKEEIKAGEEFLKQVIKDSEGNPGIIRIIVSFLYNKRDMHERIITKAHYEENFNELIALFAEKIFDGFYYSCSEQEKQILSFISKNNTEVSVSDIAKNLGKKLNNITSLILRLNKKGNIVKTERGKYKLFTKLYGDYIKICAN